MKWYFANGVVVCEIRTVTCQNKRWHGLLYLVQNKCKEIRFCSYFVVWFLGTQMTTFDHTRIIVLVMLGISLSSSSPLERLKRSLDDEANFGCIPGVWACPGLTRNIKTLSEPQKTVPEPAKVASAATGCIPGLWACDESTNKMAVEDSPIHDAATQLEGTRTENSVYSYDDDQSEDNPYKCSLGSLSCRRKRMLNRMLKHARRVERSAKKCPPGIWVCWVEKSLNIHPRLFWRSEQQIQLLIQ